MWKTLFIVAAISVAGCSQEWKCPCPCPDCGISCRNRCEEDRCIIGEACCEECLCPMQKPVKAR